MHPGTPCNPLPYHDPIPTPRPTLHSGKQSSKESRLYQWVCLHGNSHEWAKQSNPGDGVNEKWSVAMEMCWMERPHKEGYVMRWDSQNEVVSIFNSVTKIHFNKAHDPPRSSSLPPTPSSLPPATQPRFTRPPSDPSRTQWGLFFHPTPPFLGHVGTPLTNYYFPFEPTIFSKTMSWWKWC